MQTEEASFAVAMRRAYETTEEYDNTVLDLLTKLNFGSFDFELHPTEDSIIIYGVPGVIRGLEKLLDLGFVSVYTCPGRFGEIRLDSGRERFVGGCFSYNTVLDKTVIYRWHEDEVKFGWVEAYVFDRKLAD